MGRELTSRLATESFRCISKSFCASQTTGLWARQGGQMVRAQDMQSGGPSLHLQHCPDLFLGISSLQLNILATLVMANWFVSYQLDFFGVVRAVDLQSEKPKFKSRPDHQMNL